MGNPFSRRNQIVKVGRMNAGVTTEIPLERHTPTVQNNLALEKTRHYGCSGK
jgi:hypothetical protein